MEYTAIKSVRGLSTAAITVALGLAAGSTGLASAATITLTGTVRDFNDTHPDFEGAVSGLTAGIVSLTLGGDGKPVYDNCGNDVNTAPFCGDTSGQANFNQWYNNNAVNMDAPLSITLDNTITLDSNVFTFVDTGFFPIDGELFGNQGRGNNFHFTYEIHSKFTYQGGEVFDFTGDDDVWVFINDVLAVDLGGVHGATFGTVDLDTSAVALGISTGNVYDFDLFFAERHTSQSNFRIDTSIVLVDTADIGIDIKPGSFPNSINLGSGGATTVAILGSATFDVLDIDENTLTLGSAGVKTVGKKNKELCSIEDVSGDFSGGPEGVPDSFDDLVCHFITASITGESGDTSATISGDLISGGTFEGTDSVNIVP